jgi:hypothetical protein
MAVPHFNFASLRWQLYLVTTAEKLVALLHIPQVSGSIISPGLRHLTELFRGFPQSFPENDNIYLGKATTASFQILFNSSFTKSILVH